MNKLTKHQRYYRKKKKEESQDIVLDDSISPERRRRLSRRSLSIRVSLDASQRLVELSESESKFQWEMLSWIIVFGIPQVLEVPSTKYKELHPDYNPLKRYKWNKDLLESKEKGKKYKGSKGAKQLNLRVTSTAWKLLECCSNDIKLSKARIVQTLILQYKPTPKNKREKNNLNYHALQSYYADYHPRMLHFIHTED